MSNVKSEKLGSKLGSELKARSELRIQSETSDALKDAIKNQIDLQDKVNEEAISQAYNEAAEQNQLESQVRIQDSHNFTSFIEGRESMWASIKSMSREQLQHQHGLNLMALSTKTVNDRKTKQGKKCADKFLAAGKVIYLDCSNEATPDGKNTGDEWCEVDPTEKSPVKWDYCTANMDMNKVRRRVSDLLNDEANAMKKVRNEQEKLVQVGLKILKTVDTMATEQKKCNIRLEKIAAAQKQIGNDFAEILKLKGQMDQMKAKTALLATQNSLKAKESDESEEGGAEGAGGAGGDSDQAPSSKMSCEGLLGYEKAVEGDGLYTFYYDNSDLMGTPVKSESRQVLFAWNGEPPIKDVNGDNFSVSLEGWIQPPVTADYFFEVICDDGAKLTINDEVILTHNWGAVGKVKADYLEAMHESADGKSIFKKSKEVKMEGGAKYLFKLQYFHSSHNNANPSSESFLKLKWESNAFQSTFVLPKHFFKENKQEQVKVIGFADNGFELDQMINGKDAFTGMETFKQQDIPLEYQNFHQFKAPSVVELQQIVLETNTPVVIYIAVDMLKHNVLDDTWKDSQQVMSVLKVAKGKPKGPVVKAKESRPFRIHFKRFKKGEILIPLKYSPEEPTTRLIIFYGSDPMGKVEKSCGGEESNISDVTGKYYKTCVASSEHPEGKFNCDNGLNGKMEDQPFAMWASNGEGVSAWIKVIFKQTMQVFSVDYRNRENPGERTKAIKIIFDDNNSQSYELPNTPDTTNLKLNNPQPTDWVMMEILEVFGTINNGGAFKVNGVPCLVEEEKILDDPNGKTSLTCMDTLSDSQEIAKKNVKEGDSFMAYCSENCVKQADSLFIWGSLRYTDDSSICLAAFHSGVLEPDGGNFMIKLEKGLGNYQAENRNGVLSKSKEGDPAASSISFEKVLSDEMIHIEAAKEGMKVDIFYAPSNKWVPGKIEKLERIAKTDLMVELSMDGYPKEMNFDVKWPNPGVVDYCGKEIKDRECDEDSQDPVEESDKTWKFCFNIKGDCPPGYLVDQGKAFQEHDDGSGNLHSYGWGRDMTSMLRSRDESTQPDTLLRNIVLFPPHKKNKNCVVQNPAVACQPTTWSFKVPKKGAYNVKITAGDAEKHNYVSLAVNGAYVFNIVQLEADQFETNQVDINVIDGMIVISADCDDSQNKCKDVWSRMAAVEITQLAGMPLDDNKSDDGTEDLGCLTSFQGGRCSDGTNPENCIYEVAGERGSEKCNGVYKLVKIPEDCICKTQRDLFKCVKQDFPNNEECVKVCPGVCKALQCLVPIKATYQTGVDRRRR